MQLFYSLTWQKYTRYVHQGKVKPRNKRTKLNQENGISIQVSYAEQGRVYPGNFHLTKLKTLKVQKRKC
jgi:hypothetical protein